MALAGVGDAELGDMVVTAVPGLWPEQEVRTAPTMITAPMVLPSQE